MANEASNIIYTLTDVAPLLATCAFLPIIRTFAAPAGINIVKSDISVAARVLAEFPEYLTEELRLAPGPLEVACFCDDVDALKRRFDATALRLEKLAHRIEP